MEESIVKIQQMIATYGLNVLAGFAIFIIGKWAANVLSRWTESLLLKAKVEETLAKFARNFIYVAMLVFVVTAALSKVGIQTASFIAVLGAAGFAVGMALQGSLANFAAGVLILVFRPFKVGDVVTVGGMTGKVQEIDIFNTILCTPDNVRIILPNAQATSGSVVNFSAYERRRIDLVIGVGYGDNLQKTSKVLADVLAAEPRVLKNPAPAIMVGELAESSVNFLVQPWVKTADYADVKFALLQKIKEELDRNGISIPFPQRDVHFIAHQAPALQTSGR